MRIKTKVQAGGLVRNHDQTLLRDCGAGLKVKTQVRAGGKKANHNETALRNGAVGLARRPRLD